MPSGDQNSERKRADQNEPPPTCCARLRRRAALWIACLIMLPKMGCAAPNPAQFAHGKEVAVTSATVGPKGATLRTGKTGTPVDNISVEIPAGALTKEVTVTLSYNTGKLSLPRGESSGVFLHISAGTVAEFEEPMKIHVSYDPVRWKGRVLVGYAIDEKGRLASVDSGANDSKVGTATFITLVPLLFTWVYAPVH